MITNVQCISQLGYILLFSAEINKRSLHQSILELFPQVWEEVSAIFIDYLRNSPPSPYINMIAVFAPE